MGNWGSFLLSTICITPLRLPANIEEDTLDGVMQIVDKRKLPQLPIDYSAPYWAPHQRYKRLEVLTSISQYLDFHSCKLPQTVLPPENDVKEFIDKVNSSDKPLTIPAQLDIALDVAGNNIVGAANIGFIATRHSGRSYEKRAYPGIEIGPQEIREWNQRVAQFEVYDASPRYDGPGDTYYFWTHFFGALAFDALGGVRSQALQKVLEHGTP